MDVLYELEYAKKLFEKDFFEQYWWIYGVGSTTYFRGEIGVLKQEAEKFVLVVLVDKDFTNFDLLPREINGVKIEYVETEPIRILPLTLDVIEEDFIPEIEIEHIDRTKVFRPVPGGVSIGCQGITAGTMTCLVFDEKTGEPCILSNNHVIAMDWGTCHYGKEGLPILQPGPYDIVMNKLGKCNRVGTCPIYLCDDDTVKKYQIGSLYRWVPVESGKRNLIDAAIAKPLNVKDVSFEVFELGIPGKSIELTENDIGKKVVKSGRTTGITYGNIVSIDGIVRVRGWGVCTFVDQIITKPAMLRPGDSGSYCAFAEERWEDETLKSVGVGFAGSPQVSIFCKATNVEKLLKVRFGILPIETYLKYFTIPGIVSAFDVFDILEETQKSLY